MSGSLNYCYKSTQTNGAETEHLIKERVKLMSVKVHNNDAVEQTISLYDNSSAVASSLFAVIPVPAGTSVDLDYHGAILGTGLFLSRAAVSGTEANDVVVSVQVR